MSKAPRGGAVEAEGGCTGARVLRLGQEERDLLDLFRV